MLRGDIRVTTCVLAGVVDIGDATVTVFRKAVHADTAAAAAARSAVDVAAAANSADAASFEWAAAGEAAAVGAGPGGSPVDAPLSAAEKQHDLPAASAAAL